MQIIENSKSKRKIIYRKIRKNGLTIMIVPKKGIQKNM